MRKWHTVDTDKLNAPRSTQIRGVDVTVYFGLDDMPLGVSGEYEEQRKEFVIQFEYDSEPEVGKIVELDEHVRLSVGRRSERLFRVHIDVDSMEADFVRLHTRVEKVLRALPEEGPKLGMDRIDNYVAASGAFEQVGRDVINSLQLQD